MTNEIIEATATNEVATVKEDLSTKIEVKTEEVVNRIIEEEEQDKLKDLTALFNQNLAKKNIVRVVELNELLDKVNKQAKERFEKHPEEFSNKELLDYMQVVQGTIDKCNNQVKTMNDAPVIQINEQTNVVNLNNSENLTGEERERVLDAVKHMLAKMKEEPKEEADIIDLTNEENSD